MGVWQFGAFISYRHRTLDRRWAIRLHRALETYKLPRRLGLPPIGRVFRDEEELRAEPNLSTAIVEALDRSAFLIVVCSEETPGSHWVEEEVKRFQKLGRGNRILVLLVGGEPQTSLPVPLRKEEPLCADVRDATGWFAFTQRRMALLRLIARLAGCEFDQLRRRDRERRRSRSLLTAAVAASALAVVGGVLTKARSRAVTAERIASARLLAADARRARGDTVADLKSSIELALESVDLTPTADGAIELQESLRLLPRLESRTRFPEADEIIPGTDGSAIIRSTGRRALLTARGERIDRGTAPGAVALGAAGQVARVDAGGIHLMPAAGATTTTPTRLGDDDATPHLLALSPDARRAAIVYGNADLEEGGLVGPALYVLGTDKQRHATNRSTHITALAFSSTGATVVAAGVSVERSLEVRAFDVAAVLAASEEDPPRSSRFRFGPAEAPTSLAVWEAEAGDATTESATRDGDLVTARTDTVVAVGARDGLYVYLEDGRELWRVPLRGTITGAAFSGSARLRLGVCAPPRGCTLETWALERAGPNEAIEGSPIQDFVFDGADLISSAYGERRRWSATGISPLGEPVPGGGRKCTIVPTVRAGALACHEALPASLKDSISFGNETLFYGRYLVWSTPEQARFAVITDGSGCNVDLPADVLNHDVTADGSRWLVVGKDGVARAYAVKGGQCAKLAEITHGGLRLARFVPGRETLLLATDREGVEVDERGRETGRRWQFRGGAVVAMEIDARGEYFAVGFARGGVSVFHVSDPDANGHFGGPGEPTKIAFSADGQILGASYDTGGYEGSGAIRAWKFRPEHFAQEARRRLADALDEAAR